LREAFEPTPLFELRTICCYGSDIEQLRELGK